MCNHWPKREGTRPVDLGLAPSVIGMPASKPAPSNTRGSITIARHGRPDKNRRESVDWRGYEEWWRGYDEAGLAPGQGPSDALLAEAEAAHRIFASTLPRAIETARAAAPGRDIEIDPIFVEAPLPPPPIAGRFRAYTWGVFARVTWWHGMARGMESRREAEARAGDAVEKLVDAAQDGPVLLCAHGWFNRMMRPELKRRGYRCVKDGGDKYWTFRRYEYVGR